MRDAAGAASAELDLGPLFLATLHSLLGSGGRIRNGTWRREDVTLLAALPLQWALSHRACAALHPVFRDAGEQENDAMSDRIDVLARLAESVSLDSRFADLFAEWFERRWAIPDALASSPD